MRHLAIVLFSVFVCNGEMSLLGGDASRAETLIMPLGPGVAMPAFPAEGFQSKVDLAGLSVAHAMKGWAYPIGSGSTNVFAHASTQRNIYRIALR